jgi:hypothetical protein
MAVAIAGLFGLNWWTDPFGRRPSPALDAAKIATAKWMSHHDWLAAQFERNPVPNVVLGDSRGATLPAQELTKQVGEPVFNFSYGGGTFPEILRTFWFAAEHIPLKRVWIVLGFHLMDGTSRMDRASTAFDLLQDPMRYYLHPFTTKASLTVLQHAWFGGDSKKDQPPMDKEAFWQFQLDVSARNAYARYAWPDQDMAELRRIAQHCRTHGIDLQLVLAPTHVELQRRVDDFGLRAPFERSKRELADIAPLWDYDYESELTRDKSAFTDPYHFGGEAAKKIIAEITGGPAFVARKTGQRPILAPASGKPPRSADAP